VGWGLWVACVWEEGGLCPARGWGWGLGWGLGWEVGWGLWVACVWEEGGLCPARGWGWGVGGGTTCARWPCAQHKCPSPPL
jgi:hypothetical protein